MVMEKDMQKRAGDERDEFERLNHDPRFLSGWWILPGAAAGAALITTAIARGLRKRGETRAAAGSQMNRDCHEEEI